MNKLTRRLVAVVAFCGCACALSCLSVGCSVAGQEKEFSIPRSLMTRMLDAHDRMRDRDKDSGASFDAAEMVSLAVGLKMTNAQEIASRPRGAMKFCEDQLTDAERFDLWPFEIGKFEAELEAKMEVSDGVGFRLKPQFAKLAGGVVKGGLMQSNQALRWVSQEIERWAVKAMNEEFGHVGEKDFCQMFGVEKMPKDTFAWWVGPACYFIVRRGEGAWEPWEYKFTPEVAVQGAFPGMASTPRNPTIAKVLYLRKAIEMWGRGIGLIVKSCEKARIAAPKIYEDHGFIYTVFTRPTVQEWNDKVGKVNHEVNEVNGEVNEVNLHIIQILKANPQCTIPDLATACNVSRATVDRAVKALKDANRIRRIGGTRGHWEVCD